VSGPAAENRGALGEDLSARFLTYKGYTVLARNFRTRQGEVDLIAEDADFLVFAEVKTRRRGSLVSGEEAVDVHKQRRFLAAAEAWLIAFPSNKQPRCDVICIDLKPDGALASLRHYRNAF
jgi:putative endonuclease